MPDIRVSEARISPGDFNRLRKSVGWEEHDAKDIELSLRNTLFLAVAKEGSKTVGMARVIGDEGMYYYIQDVIVLPDYQGKGVGKAMMEKVMDYLERNRKKGVFIGLMAAKGKEGFYRKLGFDERPSEKYGPGMCRVLPE